MKIQALLLGAMLFVGAGCAPVPAPSLVPEVPAAAATEVVSIQAVTAEVPAVVPESVPLQAAKVSVPEPVAAPVVPKPALVPVAKPTPVPVAEPVPAPAPKPVPAAPTPAPSTYCCKVCSKGKACGNTCISRSNQCHQPPGCACDG